MRSLRQTLAIVMLALFLAAGVFALQSGGQADAADRSGTANLRAVFEKILQNQKRTLVPSLGVSLIYDGRVTVEQTRTYYAVTLPHVKMIYPDGRVFELGMISVNAVPDSKVQGRWTMSVALPMPMVMLSPDGSPRMRINAGEQKAVGVWDERLGGFIKFESVYKDVKIDGGTLAYNLNIPELRARYDFSDNTVKVNIGDAVLNFVLGELFAGTKR